MNDLKTILTILLFSILISCSKKDDSTVVNPPNTNNENFSDYMPSINGSWWIFQQNYYNIDGTLDNRSYDTTSLIGTTIHYDKNAMILVEKYSDSQPNDTSYFYTEGSKLYVSDFSLALGKEKTWIGLLDLSGTIVTFLDVDMTNEDMGIGLFTGKGKGITKYIGKENIKINNNNYDAAKFEMNIILNGNMKVFGTPSVPFNDTTTSYVYFVKGIGRVGTVTPQHLESGKQDETLIDYFIKK